MFNLYFVKGTACICKRNITANNLFSSFVFGKVTTKVFPINVHTLKTDNCEKKHVIVNASEDTLPIIYKGLISDKVFRVKRFSFMTSFLTLACQPLLYEKATENGIKIGAQMATSVILGIFTFLTPVLLHMVTKKYVLLIKYSPEDKSYVVVTYSFFLGHKVDKFRLDDIVVPDMPALFSNFQVNGNAYFIEKDGFTDINHYKMIMGYDKPISFNPEKLDPNKK